MYESDQYVHVVYEYLEGKDVISRIQYKNTYAEKDVSWLAKSLLKVVNYIHEKNIMIRNLSPESLFLA